MFGKCFECRHTLFYCTLLYCASQGLCFLQIERKTLHQLKDQICFTAILAFIHWSGIKPTRSLRYVYNQRAVMVTKNILSQKQSLGRFLMVNYARVLPKIHRCQKQKYISPNLKVFVIYRLYQFTMFPLLCGLLPAHNSLKKCGQIVHQVGLPFPYIKI